MRRRKKSRAILAALIGVLTLTGTAAGYAAGRVFTIRPGNSADLVLKAGKGIWRCSNVRGRYVNCQGGDAYPYVKLGGGVWPCDCVTVKVYTLRDPQGGHIIRTYGGGYPVYIFRAL